MPKKKRPEEKPEEQIERFVETARKVGIDDDGKAADEAFKKVATGDAKHPKPSGG